MIEQSEKDVARLGWNVCVTGVRGICGINNIKDLNFDKELDLSFVEMFVKRLGFSFTCHRIIKNRSANGFHYELRWCSYNRNACVHCVQNQYH